MTTHTEPNAITEDAQIAALSPREKPYKTFLGGGLYVVVSPKGRRVFKATFRIDGRSKTVPFKGAHPNVSLAKARAWHVDIRAMLAVGRDPHEQAQSTKTMAVRFEDLARRYLRNRAGVWSERYLAQTTRLIEQRVLPFCGRKHPNDITVAHVRQIIERIEDTGACDTAEDARQKMSAIFRLGIVGNESKHDPAAPLKGQLKRSVRRNFPAMRAEHIPAFFSRLRDSAAGPMTKLGLKLIAHMPMRSKELRFARWSHINWDRAQIRLPADLMKDERANRKATGDYIMPLSRQSLELLRELESLSGRGGPDGFLFPHRTEIDEPISSGTWYQALQDMDWSGKHTVHGFRSLFSTTCNEEFDFAPKGVTKGELIEVQLDHLPRDAVRAAYLRAGYVQHRAVIMQWWSDYLSKAEWSKTFTQPPRKHSGPRPKLTVVKVDRAA